MLQMETDSWIENAGNGLMGKQASVQMITSSSFTKSTNPSFHSFDLLDRQEEWSNEVCGRHLTWVQILNDWHIRVSSPAI